MGSSSMVVTGAELSLLQTEINTAISAIWERLERLEGKNQGKTAAKPEADPDFDPVAEIPLKVDSKPASKKATKKVDNEPEMAFEVE